MQYGKARSHVDRLHAVNSRKANYLINVPPNRQGKIDDAAVKVLEEIGKLQSE